MRIGPAGIALVKSFEGLRLAAYRDPIGLWTIGYGHTAGVREGDVITEAQAHAFLIEDLELAERCVTVRTRDLAVTQGQFDALVSFVFNVGCGAFDRSTLLRKLRSGDIEGAADQLLRWIHAGGTPLAGLERRRQAERELFLSDAAPAGGESLAMSATGAPMAPQPASDDDSNVGRKDFAQVDQPAQATQPASSAEEVPAPVEERSFGDAPMPAPLLAPFLSAALPLIVEAVPSLIRIFGSESEVTDRNARAAERIAEVVQQATGSQNLMQAVERLQTDPQARTAAQDAVQRAWFDIVESGGGGVAGARDFAALHAGTRYGRVIETVSYAALGFLVLANIGVGISTIAAIWQGSEHLAAIMNLGGMVVQADIGAATTAFGFWLGAAFKQQQRADS